MKTKIKTKLKISLDEWDLIIFQRLLNKVYEDVESEYFDNNELDLMRRLSVSINKK